MLNTKKAKNGSYTQYTVHEWHQQLQREIASILFTMILEKQGMNTALFLKKEKNKLQKYKCNSTLNTLVVTENYW